MLREPANHLSCEFTVSFPVKFSVFSQRVQDVATVSVDLVDLPLELTACTIAFFSHCCWYMLSCCIQTPQKKRTAIQSRQAGEVFATQQTTRIELVPVVESAREVQRTYIGAPHGVI